MNDFQTFRRATQLMLVCRAVLITAVAVALVVGLWS
jgi:hypothetical protein